VQRPEVEGICIDYNFDQEKVDAFLNQYQMQEKYQGIQQFEWNQTANPQKRVLTKIERSKEQAKLRNQQKKKEQFQQEREARDRQRERQEKEAEQKEVEEKEEAVEDKEDNKEQVSVQEDKPRYQKKPK